MASMGESEDDREAALLKREDDVARREAVLVDRVEAARDILHAAALRDVEADLRDETSVKRDQDADLAAFIDSKSGDSYGSGNPARRYAALDRGYAKDDRASAADDREMLTEASEADTLESPEG
jgi:hypothetical protein